MVFTSKQIKLVPYVVKAAELGQISMSFEWTILRSFSLVGMGFARCMRARHDSSPPRQPPGGYDNCNLMILGDTGDYLDTIEKESCTLK
jgi:hypothetical protein